MLILHFWFLVVSYITLIKNVQSSKELKPISWFGFDNKSDPPTIIVSWNEVESVDDQDPVIGYKVYVWEVKKIKKIKNIHHFNGTVEHREVEEYPRAKRVNGTNVIPEGKLTVLDTPANNRTVSIRVKLEVPYQFVVTAYTKNMMGPPSAISGRTLHGPDWKSKLE